MLMIPQLHSRNVSHIKWKAHIVALDVCILCISLSDQKVWELTLSHSLKLCLLFCVTVRLSLHQKALHTVGFMLCHF